MVVNYFQFRTRFWTGRTGRQLREFGAEAQVLAIYLFTCPSANPLGLYYLPHSSVCHETGLLPLTVDRVFAQLETIGFAFYDRVAEEVWVPSMARMQIGDTLKPVDNRCRGIRNALSTTLADHVFVERFRERYRDAFHLDDELPETRPARVVAPEKPDTVPFEEFWQRYPRKVSKQDAQKAWVKLKVSRPLFDTIVAALAEQQRCEQWRKDGGAFIPHAATWLNGGRWQDEPTNGAAGDDHQPEEILMWQCPRCDDIHETPYRLGRVCPNAGQPHA